MKNNKAFTLIELLVVISIIGVISSIIFVSFSGSRDKARLAKAQNFDAQISHALGAYAVGIWRFEDIGPANEIYDESGYSNDGIANGPSLVDSEVYPGTKALNFNGSHWIDYGNNTIFNPRQHGWTASIWLKLTHGAQYVRMIDRHGGGTPYWILRPTTSSTDAPIFQIVDGVNSIGVTGNTDVTDGTWHHIVYLYDYDNSKTSIYVDGKEDATNDWSGLSPLDINPTMNMRIGAANNGGERCNGTIDNVRIYNEALSSAQIQQHFVAGAASHGIAIND